jgi:hypothetical protein
VLSITRTSHLSSYIGSIILAKPASPHGHALWHVSVAADRPADVQTRLALIPDSPFLPVPARACAFAGLPRRGISLCIRVGFLRRRLRAAPSPLFTFSPGLALALPWVSSRDPLVHSFDGRASGRTAISCRSRSDGSFLEDEMGWRSTCYLT